MKKRTALPEKACRARLTTLPARHDTIEPVSFCGGADDPSLSSAWVCCGTPVEAAKCCSEGDNGGGFGWYNASIINYDMVPLSTVASSTSVSCFACQLRMGSTSS